MAFEHALLELEKAEHRKPLVVDLSRLRFVDLAGARAVICAQRRARRAGRELHVVEPFGAAGRLSDLVGRRCSLYATAATG